VDNDDDRFVRTPQEWLVPHLPSRAGDGGLKWRPKIERDASCCTKRRGLAGVHNPACILLQSLAEKCRELIYGLVWFGELGRKTLYQNSCSISFVFGKKYPNFN
jgi:hypothetical protein